MRKFRPRVTTAIAAATLTTLAAAGVAAQVTPAAAASSGAVVNEVYGGGGNSGATLTNDFIALANARAGAFTLDGWSVQYIPASPGGTTTWQVTPLTGSLAAGGPTWSARRRGRRHDGPAPDTGLRHDHHGRTPGTVALVESRPR